MSERTKLARYYLKSISTKEEMLGLLEKLLLSPMEYMVLKKIYLENKSIGEIADINGYSMQTIKISHRRALLKVYTYIADNDVAYE